MKQCKTKAIQAGVAIFTHILAYSEDTFITRYIQNRGIFRTLVYSEPCQTFAMERFR